MNKKCNWSLHRNISLLKVVCYHLIMYMKTKRRLQVQKKSDLTTQVAVTPHSNIKLYFHHKRGTSSRTLTTSKYQ